MSTMREYRINGTAFLQAPALLAQGQRVYASQGFDESYGLVYTMFPGIPTTVVDCILRGDIQTYCRGNTVIYFLDEDTPNE